MPYIKQGYRTRLNTGQAAPMLPGELNYLLTRMCDMYLNRLGPDDPPDYADLNEVVGVLECVKQEFYRRVVVPYEDRKREENGDVYGRES